MTEIFTSSDALIEKPWWLGLGTLSPCPLMFGPAFNLSNQHNNCCWPIRFLIYFILWAPSTLRQFNNFVIGMKQLYTTLVELPITHTRTHTHAPTHARTQIICLIACINGYSICTLKQMLYPNTLSKEFSLIVVVQWK